MKPRQAKRHWQNFAGINPYYAVVSLPQFAGEISNETRAAFFATGERDVSGVFNDIREHLSSDFRPRRALDFGCGVGRIVLALSSRCDHVVGVDISEGMLDAAREATAGTGNVSFTASGDLSGFTGAFDLIHSYITLQHINPKTGLMILRRMINLLEEKGVGVLHFTYHSDASRAMKLKAFLHSSVPFAHPLINLIKGRPSRYPYTTMNQYDLNEVFRILQEGNCEHFFTRYANHSGQLGVMLYFQKRSDLVQLL